MQRRIGLQLRIIGTKSEDKMEGLELLAIALSALFGVGMIFSILLWCRSWRREEREQTDTQVQTLRSSIRKLTEAVEMLDHTAASLQSADGLLTQQLEDLRRSIKQIKSIRTTPAPQEPVAPKPVGESTPCESSKNEPVIDETQDGPGAYDAVSDLLEQGKSTVEIARELDIGVAEVRMIARMKPEQHPSKPDSKDLIERG